MTYEDIGKRIKTRRKELKISALELGDRVGLSKATIHRYENGDIKNIKMPVVEAMAQILKVNPLWLLGKSEVKDGRTTYDVVYHGKPISKELKGKLIFALQILIGSLSER